MHLCKKKKVKFVHWKPAPLLLSDSAAKYLSPTTASRTITGGGCKLLSSPHVQNGCGAHPASYPMGTRSPFTGVKRPGVKLTTHLRLVPRSSGWSFVRSASLSMEGTSKKRPSPHLHKVPTRNSKLRLRTFQTALV
jgi:hypothetical protein